MSTWPDKPLIRIIRGKVDGSEIANEIAFRRASGAYTMISREYACVSATEGSHEDSIDEWEEVTLIPTSALEALGETWKGFGMYTPGDSQRITDAIATVLDCLPADKPSALDRAVTRVKDIKGDRMIDADSTQEERLSLLLDALASVQGATRKTAPLTMVTRICVDWANLENPRRDSLKAALGRTKVLSDPGSFIVLSALVGDVTTSLCDSFSPRHDLIDVTAYALAWAAQTIEEEEDK